MNQIQTEFLKLYPLYPAQLLEKFYALLPAELAAKNSEYGKDFLSFYNSFSASEISWSVYNQDVTFSVFNPANGRYVRQWSFSELSSIISFWPSERFGYFIQSFEPPDSLTDRNYSSNPYNANIMRVTARVNYDIRLFGDLSFSPKLRYEKTYFGSQSFLDFMSYTSVNGHFLSANYVLKPNSGLLPYSGIQSLIALYENGLSMPDINYTLLYAFNDTLEAMKKFSGEIQSAAELSAIENSQKLGLYRNDLTDKLKSEKNQLENLSLSLTAATQSDLQSAKRDMLSIALQAQTLKQSIQNGLRVYNGN